MLFTVTKEEAASLYWQERHAHEPERASRAMALLDAAIGAEVGAELAHVGRLPDALAAVIGPEVRRYSMARTNDGPFGVDVWRGTRAEDDGYDFMEAAGRRGWLPIPGRGDWPYLVIVARTVDAWRLELSYCEGDMILELRAGAR